MEQTQNSNNLLIGIGALLFISGLLTAYLFLPKQTVEVAAPANEVTEEEVESNDVVAALPVAPEDYVVPVPDAIETINLPEPDAIGSITVANALLERRSNRQFADSALTLQALSQMLWSGIGVTDSESGLRTVPSRGEVYPVGYYVAVDRVEGLEQGLYYYLPETHQLSLVIEGDQSSVWESMTGQPHPGNAAATLLMTANMARGEGFRDTTFQESGHVGQSLYLQAVEQNLAMLVMGGFDKTVAADYLGLDEYHHVVYLVPIGNPG